MELVLAHRNMDFDCLASQLAVTKLYPAAVMVPAHPLSARMRGFLTLYRDILPLTDLHYVSPAALSHVYLVDCHSTDRLDERARRFFEDLRPECGYTIFDHHSIKQEQEPFFKAARSDSVISLCGAATTILVQKIKEQKIELSHFEATVLLAGIYEDTGCLTHRGTTETDVLAVAYLLSKGADLERVMDMVRPKLDDRQAELLEQLLSSSRAVNLPAARVTVCSAASETYVDGLADISSLLLDSTASDAVISVCKMNDRVHIVCRSESQRLDMRLLVQNFGGAGHPGAASAVVKGADLDATIEEVLVCLRSQSRPEKTAAEIMSSPVRTILSDLSMDEAGRIMLRHALDGLVVMQDDRVVGVVSKRDVDKARHHKLDHAPVKGFMSHPVITVQRNTALSEIQSIMIREDVGRLPVLSENGDFVGLVSRHEVLKTLHGERNDPGREDGVVVAHREVSRQDELLGAIDEEILGLYKQIGVQSAALDMVAYLVGGCVRDLLLSRKNSDLDFVIEGDARKLARTLCEKFPDIFGMLAEHERFCTAAIVTKSGREIDLATARTEYYEYPAALPTVEPSSLEQDLFRRDFTINALAMNLHPDHFGEIVDFYSGLADMDANLIRILHPFSFIEDPTRIIRGARFAARLGFSFERKTMLQAQRAISLGIFDNLGGVRLKEELRMILDSAERLLALDILRDAGGGLRFLDEELVYTARIRLFVRRAERLLERYPLERDWVVYLGVLLSDLSFERLQKALERLQLADDEKAWIVNAQRALFDLSRLDDQTLPSQIYKVLHGHSDYSLAIAACLSRSGSSMRRFIKLYFDKLRFVKPLLNGNDVLALGTPVGPTVGRLLERLLAAKLDGEVKEVDDERHFVERYLKEDKPE